ncbi:MAG: GNAT family protein [Bacteroidales bacterium]|jgi:RimJ/RimL family protein N-acetyltransferase
MAIREQEGIRLRELLPEDKPVLAHLANDEKIRDNVRDSFPFPYTEKDAENFIGLCKKEDPKTTFAIDCQNELSGVIGLVPLQDIYRKSAEIGYWIGEPYRNKGIATVAVRQIVNYGFGELQLIRIFTGVFEHNKASQRVLEKCGFTLEAISKNAIFKNNRIMDEYRYVILKS